MKYSICFSKLSNVCLSPEHTTSSSVSKKPRLDQIPAANLDADDPLTDVCFVSCFYRHSNLYCFLKYFFVLLALKSALYFYLTVIQMLNFIVDFIF